MEEMMRKFKEEFKSVYCMYLEASDTVDAMDSDHKTYDDEDRANAWSRYKRKSGQMYELRKVAKILGYTQEQMNIWENEVYDKYNCNT